jgi:hypothetical protein
MATTIHQRPHSRMAGLRGDDQNVIAARARPAAESHARTT